VSIHHNSIRLPAVQVHAPLGAINAVRTAIWPVVTTIRTGILQRWTHRHLTRLSDHMLQDFGFEREWDGTIHARRDAD